MVEQVSHLTADALREIILEAISSTTLKPQRLAYDIDEAAEALGVSRRTIEGLIADHKLKSKLVGKKRLISIENLRKLLA